MGHSTSASAALAAVGLDATQLATIAYAGPPPVFAAVSGAHLYGFASPDSDVDLRGAFLLPARALLGLKKAEETVTVVDKSSLDLDWVAHDVRKFARLLTQHNGYVLEQLYSPLVVVTTPAHAELRELARGCITRPTARHYQGFARGRRRRLQEPAPTVKHLLYALRVYLTGIHLMRSGEVEAHAVQAAAHVGGGFEPSVRELVERKRSGAEAMALTDDDRARHEPLLDRLEALLHEAHDRSALPLEPEGVAALEDFVVRLRWETP